MFTAIDESQGSTVVEQPLSSWSQLPSSNAASEAIDWEHSLHPPELELLLDGPDTPYELIQIIKKSLQQWESEVPPSLQPNPKKDSSEYQEEHLHDSSSESDSSQTSGDENWSSILTSPTTDGETSSSSISCKSHELKPKASFLTPMLDRLTGKSSNFATATTSSSAQAKEEKKRVVTVECVSCFDELPTGEVTSLSCKHGYCRTCFVKLITTAMQNESSFPPKCCLTEIKLPAILHALNTEQREMYKLKAAEWAQPAGSRWYCPKPECAKWIAPSGILRSRSSGQRCPHCRTKICGMCRGLAHDQVTECPQDFGLNATLDAAEREGWQRCYRCRSLVEKTIGCRHITCKCKAEFCYTCGSRWRTCQCTEVDEVRRAAQLQERRSAMDAEARREEQEIARAIAEVEALELREAEDRRLAEQRREEERRREEEELRRLEELRLQELEKRRKEEEEAERNRIEAIKFSIEGRGTFLVTILKELVQIQQLALISRHESSEQEARTTLEEQQNMNRAEYEFFKQKMLANMKKRSKSLKDKHDTEVKIMTARHQNNEDSMFLDIQLFYKGRPNREARERTMFESLARSHKEELAALTERHQYESYILKRNAAIEGKGLQHGYSSKEQSAKSKLESQKATLERKIAFERKWFEVVTNRRFELLQELHLDQLRTMGESTLLKNWEVLPSLKAVAEVEADAEVKSERQGGTSSNVEDDLDALIGHIAAFSPSQETEALQLSSPPLRNPARRNQTSLSPEKHLPDTAEKVVDPRPPQTSQPTISVSPVDTSSATEDSSQAIWETQSRLSSRSATPTTSASSSSSNTPPSSESSISRTSLTLPRTQKRMAKGTEKKESRWSLGKWFGREEKVVDEKTMREMLMGAVGDAR